MTQHGDLTISGGSSLTIDGVEDNAKQASHTGIGIASWDDITVEDGSTLEISDATTGIYGHQGSDASLTVEDSALNIAGSSFGIDYEGAGKDKEGNVLKSAGDITFDNAEVDINITPKPRMPQAMALPPTVTVISPLKMAQRPKSKLLLKTRMREPGAFIMSVAGPAI